MKNNIFKIVTGIAGVYHVLLAAIGLLFPIEITSKAFTFALGVNIAATPQLEFIGKFVAVYMLAFGIILLILAFNPAKYRALTFAGLAVFGIRFINRVFFFGMLSTTFGMTASRNLIGSGLIFLFFIVMLLTMPKKQA